MESRYFREYSPSLDRDMEFKVYGHGGKLCLAFPSQNGRFYDFEGFGMTDTLRPWIEEGRLLLVCPDSIDGETWSNQEKTPRERIELQEHWFLYITLELLPRARDLGRTAGKALATGCSMGATHSGIVALRRPDIFDSCICMSGFYHAGYFFGGYMDDLVYNNSPVDFIANMPADHPYIGMYNNNRFIFCVGQGAWEDELLDSTRRLQNVFQQKGIHCWVDIWGLDVNHDWPWWKKQFPYFLDKLL